MVHLSARNVAVTAGLYDDRGTSGRETTMTSAGTDRVGHKRIAGLDLVRGLAIALVLVRHAWPELIGSGGIVGVVAFLPSADTSSRDC